MKKIINFFTLFAGITLISPFLSSCSNYDTNYKIYDLWVGGVKVTSRNQSDILKDGTVSYVHQETGGILTLNNANITQTFALDVESCILTWMDDLTINVVGENKVGLGEYIPVDGIVAKNLIIEGDGSLDVGGKGSCIKGDNISINSSKITTHLEKQDSNTGSIMGVGIWASYDLNITGGDVEVCSTAPYSPFSYGIYSTENINISGGNIQIKQENAFEIGIGLIASEKINITGGNVDVYGLDDAINVRHYEQSGGNISAKALDFFGDGACRLVSKASILGGSFSTNILMRPAIDYPNLYSEGLTIADSLIVKGGSDSSNLEEKDKTTYLFNDVYVEIR